MKRAVTIFPKLGLLCCSFFLSPSQAAEDKPVPGLQLSPFALTCKQLFKGKGGRDGGEILCSGRQAPLLKAAGASGGTVL